MADNYSISTDKSKLDVDLIHQYLAEQSYWAKGRSKDVVRLSVDHSLCFGVYQGDAQVGFARVVTDFAVFAWIMDLFILPQYQVNGLGKELMMQIKSHPQLQVIRRWGLATDDAHGLYQQFDFKPLEKPNMFMEILNIETL